MKIHKYLILSFFVIPNAFAGMTVKEYQQVKSNEDISWYIAGLGNGFAFSNTQLESVKQKKLYCQPEKLKISVGDLTAFLGTRIQELGSPKEVEGLQIEPILLSALINRYPCK